MSSPTETRAAGAERIGVAFEHAGSEDRAALMPYMMGGFPDLEASRALADAYVEAGADLIELGIPFSDPLADGPVIHSAATEALRAGATLESVLGICAHVAGRIPVVPMIYTNMALSRGPDACAKLLAEAGAAGVIVPDLPMEEAGPLVDTLDGAGIALVPLVAPTTPVERRRAICSSARGFVYVVSDTRVTGERNELPPRLAGLIEATKADSDVPVAVGFGIGTPEQAAEVGRVADGVIIGSRLVRAVAEAGDADAASAAVGEFLRATRAALAGSR